VYDSGGFPTVRPTTSAYSRNILILSCQITYDEKLLIDYRFMDANDITPRFEFGFGLSYTTFSYSGLSIVPSTGQYAYTVSFTVQNTGNVDGTEIPQLYLAFPASAGEPKRILRGFDEVKLATRASSTVSLGLTARDIRFVVSSLCAYFP
jgi:beta-glucosidase